MKVRVVQGDPLRDEGTVIVVTGTDVDTGRRITFAGDRRPMMDFLAAVDAECEAVAHVEPWQVLP